MSAIFLSYRRTDSPQAWRVHDWLVRRFGADEVFMDLSAIPFAVNYAEFIGEALKSSKVVIALIGAQWHSRLNQPDDPVKMELEVALANNIPVLPVLIGTTPMPNADELPASIATIARQNAAIVGVVNDFDTHMRALVPKIEAILGSLVAQTVASTDPFVVDRTCRGIIDFLRRSLYAETVAFNTQLEVIVASDFQRHTDANRVTLYLHRVSRVAKLELHILLSSWGQHSSTNHSQAGLVMHMLEQFPVVPHEFFPPGPLLQVKIRRSDEDPREIWKMITPDPLQLSMAYVATVSAQPAIETQALVPPADS